MGRPRKNPVRPQEEYAYHTTKATKNNLTRWVDRDALYDETWRYQQSLRKNPETARPSEAWGRMILRMIENTLTCKRYNRLAMDVKDDIRSECYEAAMKCAKKADLTKPPVVVFAYYATNFYYSGLSVLGKMKKRFEKHEKYVIDELKLLGVSDAMIEYILHGNQTTQEGDD